MSAPATSDQPAFRAGVDIGGTFTDIVLLAADGRLHTKKIGSSVDDYSRAIVEGLNEVFDQTRLGGPDVKEIRHGTTVASNAILEKKGARTGLIGTKGFRDILEIRTLRMPRLYDMRWEKPAPLVERDLRMAVDERIDCHGTVLRPLDPIDAERAVARLLAAEVEAIAICLLNAFANPIHEQAIKRIVERLAPGLTVCTSFEVLPEIKEYERTSTTVINAYLKPVIERYLVSLRDQLDRSETRAPVFLMQSSGGLTRGETAAELPIHIVESGPAGGVVGSLALARSIGLSDVVTFDMGGTTAKASLIENGAVTRVHQCEIGAGVISGTRLLSGGGYTLKVPAIDLAEVGAGGGSIIRVDAGGSMRVGPHSAGATPGPVAYDAGGEEATVTDASIVLGYINADYLVGGSVRLNAAKAADALEQRVARPLGLTVEQAAYGAHQIVAANMIRAIKSVSTERGRDVRGYAMFAFGGNGPLFAARMASELGMTRIVVPPAPGLFSSFGLLWADVEHHYSRTFRRLLREIDLVELNKAWDQLTAQAVEQLATEGYRESAQVRRAANLHYRGQTFELTVPVPDGPIDRATIAALEEAFGREHERTYGHRAGPDEPVQLVTILVTGYVPSARAAVPERLVLGTTEVEPPRPRRAYFGPERGWLETPVLRRRDLSQAARQGPLIVEEYDATCLVPPSARARLDGRSNIILELS